MRYASGPQFIYTLGFLPKGEATPWHSHKFPHNSFVPSGEALVEIGTNPLTWDGEGRPTSFEYVETATVKADDEKPLYLVPANLWHRITAMTDRTRVLCVFSHFDPETGEPLSDFKYANQEAYA